MVQDAATPERARFYQLYQQAVDAYKSKQPQQARDIWQQAAAVAKDLPELAAGLVQAAIAFGDLQESYGDFEDARAVFVMSLAVCQQHSLPLALSAICVSRLAVNSVNRDDDPSAANLFAEALHRFEGDDDRDPLEFADCLNHYGHLLRLDRQWAAAIDAYARAYNLYPQITSLPQADKQQRRLALRNSLKSTAEQSDDSVRNELRERVRAMLPRKNSPDFP